MHDLRLAPKNDQASSGSAVQSTAIRKGIILLGVLSVFGCSIKAVPVNLKTVAPLEHVAPVGPVLPVGLILNFSSFVSKNFI